MDFAKLRRADWMVLGGGVVLVIGLFAFAWYSVDGFTAAATSSPYAIWGILALIVTIVIVGDYALALFSPQTQIPTTKYGRDLTRLAACVTAGAWAIVQRASAAGAQSNPGSAPLE